MAGLGRRDFLKAAGITGAVAFLGCSSESAKKLIPYIIPPDDIVPGTATWYATTCRECPAGCGVLAKNREGRIVKVEGNPLHPINEGKLCARGQAALQGIYNPDRVRTPLQKVKEGWRSLSFAEAETFLKEKAQGAARKGTDRIRMVTEVAGESFMQLFTESLRQWNSRGPLVFEPFAYESLKAANGEIFGVKGLVSYRMEEADLLISFGADFLETWLSPVEYARKFKAMHSFKDGKKGIFFHVGPYQSLTGANADLWLSCTPGGETAVALGFLREALNQGKGKHLPETVRMEVEKIVSPFTEEKVAELSGMNGERYRKAVISLIQSKRPLILGTGAGAGGPHSLQTEQVVNVLNLILDSKLSLFDFQRRHRAEIAASREEVLEFFEGVKRDPVDLLFLNNVNPLFTLPPGRLCRKSVHGSTSSPRTDHATIKINYLAVRPEPFDTVHPELVEGMNGAQDRLVEGRTTNYDTASGGRVQEALEKESLFVVSFSNFLDETTAYADLVFPVGLSLETWDEYNGKHGLLSTLQPAMPSLTGAPHLGDILLRTAFTGEKSGQDFRAYLFAHFVETKKIKDEENWLRTLQKGGIFDSPFPEDGRVSLPKAMISNTVVESLRAAATRSLSSPRISELVFITSPSIRFFDGRGANRPWLGEIPDPLTQVTWQTPVLVHPETLKKEGLRQEDVILLRSPWGALEAPVYETESVRPEVLVMALGQGHEAFGRYAQGMGINPLFLLPREPDPASGGPVAFAKLDSLEKTGRKMKLAHTDGSRIQHQRKLVFTTTMAELAAGNSAKKQGLAMEDFPLTLPLPEGYERGRDIYLPHSHIDYRWVMVVDLDRCIGCGACAAACYAENNVAVVGLKSMLKQREMSWLAVQRYHDPEEKEKILFLPMLCQHCDNAPCESVCPVYASHHSIEGINNQIYNRCIGTRFCSQNCPYKVRRFNWFDWRWPEPLNLQLNPDVTVRSKGVMEKCSFCIQRVKEAHGRAKNEKRKIRDGEIYPACLQTCPTGVFTFGNLLDKESKVRKLAEDKRAYQVLGYLNTKPAVIYLKKVVQEF